MAYDGKRIRNPYQGGKIHQKKDKGTKKGRRSPANTKNMNKDKAWAVIDKKGKLAAVQNTKPSGMFYVSSWCFSLDGYTVVPCTISYSLNSRRKKTAKRKGRTK